MKSFGAILILVLAAERESFGQFRSEKPHITRNYAAEFNKTVSALPESRRAWPVYIDVMITIAPDAPMLWRYHGHEPERVIHNAEVAAYLKKHQVPRSRAIEASKLPHLGHILTDKRAAHDIRFSARRLTEYERSNYTSNRSRSRRARIPN